MFEGDPVAVRKLFVVGINVSGCVRFFKPTSKTSKYENDPTQIKGVVLYQAGEVNCFPDKTVIDPAAKTFDISHSHLRRCSLNGTLDFQGTLPEDFREKVLQAVINHPRMRKAQRDNFFRWFGRPAGLMV